MALVTNIRQNRAAQIIMGSVIFVTLFRVIVLVPDSLWGFGRILGSGIIRTSMWTHFSSWIHGRTNGLATRRRMSRLTARIMAIMLFPLAIFLVGLLSFRSISYDADPIRVCCP